MIGQSNEEFEEEMQQMLDQRLEVEVENMLDVLMGEKGITKAEVLEFSKINCEEAREELANLEELLRQKEIELKGKFFKGLKTKSIRDAIEEAKGKVHYFERIDVVMQKKCENVLTAELFEKTFGNNKKLQTFEENNQTQNNKNEDEKSM